MRKLVLTITGPSTSGKSTLEKRLLDRYNAGKIVSVTTRAPRPGEVDGRDYYFVSEAEFDRLEASGAFVESIEFPGGRYAATRAEFERVFAEGKFAVVVCEPVGAHQIREACLVNEWEGYSVFVDCPTDVLLERFRARYFREEESLASLDRYKARLWNLVFFETLWAGDMRLITSLRIPHFCAETEERELDRIGVHFAIAPRRKGPLRSTG